MPAALDADRPLQLSTCPEATVKDDLDRRVIGEAVGDISVQIEVFTRHD